MSQTSARPIAAGAPRWAARLLILAVILLFTVSPMALAVVGVKYDLPEGPFWQKLHPCTLVGMLALAIDIMARPYPLRRIQLIVTRFPGAMYFIAMWFMLIAHGMLNQQAQFTAIVEPYAISLVALFMIDEIGEDKRNFLRLFLHAAILANALIGVAEYLSHARLFPYVIGGAEVEGDYRSTALLGHPLLNACTTGAYILCLVMGGGGRMSPVWRVMALLISALGMIAFGGRTAIAASALVLALIALKKAAAFLLGARIDIRRALAAFVISPLLLAGVAGAAQAGAFDAFVARYVDDNGSGEARVIVLELFRMFDVGDLLIGPRADLVNSGLKLLGIEIGIENNWLALLFQYGAWMETFFTLALFALFFEFWRRGRRGVTLLFLYFLAIISSAIGLAAKTLIFAQFAMLLLVLFTPDDEAAPSR